MTASQFEPFQSQPHPRGMNVNASTPCTTGQHHGHFAQSTVDPHSLNNTGRTPPRTDHLHTVDLPSTSRMARTMHTYVTFPAHASSVTVYGTDPVASEAQIPTFRSSSTVHNCATWTIQMQTHPPSSTPTSPAAFITPGHPLIEPQLHEVEEETPALLSPLNPTNCLLDPWSPELAHTFPWDVRGAALTNFLDDLEPLLDLPHA